MVSLTISPPCRRGRPFIVRLLAALLLVPALPAADAAADSEVWRGDEWNTDVALPAGNYSGAGKTVDVQKEVSISVNPGASVENVKFDGKAKWSISGSLFREVSIAGDMGLLVGAKDSAFENCDFFKSGSWFVNLWSTRWRFENCVFGRRFFGRTLGVTDYSVRAVNCTFYDLELPAIGYKDDPANLAQSEDLKFERCRFVNCSVPESLLAATTGCVFENCTFPSKRDDWSKAQKPISVSVSIVSRARPPRSYENGPLKVEFKTLAPPPAGASIPVTSTNGRLKHAGLQPGNVQKIGALDGSQIAKAEMNPSVPNPPATSTSAGSDTPEEPPVPGPGKKSFFGIPVNDRRGSPGNADAPSGNKTLQVPLFIAQPGGGFAAVTVRLTATVTPIGQTIPAVISLPQFSGIEGQRALAIVKKLLAKQWGEWPKGQRVDIAFSERIVPADLHSALFGVSVLADAIFSRYDIDPQVAVAGVIDGNGVLAPAPWMPTRLLAALRADVRRLVAPEKSASHVADLMLIEGATLFSSMQIFGASAFDEVPPLVAANPDESMANAMREFGRAQQQLAEAGSAAEAALKNPAVMESFRDTLVLSASHLSARMLLGHSSGRYNSLSLAGSIETVESTAPKLVQAARSTNPAMIGGLTPVEADEQVAALTELKPKLDPKAVPWQEAILRYAEVVRTWQANPTRTPAQAAELITSLNSSARLVQTEWSRLVPELRQSSK